MNDILTGKTTEHLESFAPGLLVHKRVLSPLKQLQELAGQEGFDLQVASAFRGFEAQLTIWNEKCLGKRPVLSDKGERLDTDKLSDEQLVFAILRWSALPGASRHHWGTDLDVFDKGSLPDGARIKLVPQEARGGGNQRRFSEWLSKALPSQKFFRPYEKDQGGVSPEWWHISYAPISKDLFEQFSLGLLKRTIEASLIEQKQVVLENLDAIFKRYVTNIIGA